MGGKVNGQAPTNYQIYQDYVSKHKECLLLKPAYIWDKMLNECVI